MSRSARAGGTPALPAPSYRLRLRRSLPARHQRLGRLHRDGGVAAIGVGADRLGEGFVQRRAADQHDIIVAHAFFLKFVDHHFHIGHGGGQQRRHAENLRLVLVDRLEIFLDAVVDADVEHLESGPLHHHADEVLADVVDVALDGADHHPADLGRAGGGQQRAQDRHAALHRIGRHQHFRHEQDAVAKVDADDPHALDQRLGQHLIGRPAAAEQDAHALFDLLLQAVVEVVVNLRDEFVVRQRRQVEVVIGHRTRPRRPNRRSPRRGSIGRARQAGKA